VHPVDSIYKNTQNINLFMLYDIFKKAKEKMALIIIEFSFFIIWFCKKRENVSEVSS
jgi:hypothetical protein